MQPRQQNDILSYFPYEKARDVQAEVLRTLEREWENYDIFVVVAPTASGKSALARTIMGWTGSASYVVPTNQLVHQFLSEFPDTPTLHAVDQYHCEIWDRPCGVTRRREGGFCRGCECSKDVAQATYRQQSGVYNYWTYMARRIYRPTLVVDEAHNLTSLIAELEAERIWQHAAGYPNSIRPNRPETVANWLESLPARRLRGKKLRRLHHTVTSEAPQYILERTTQPFNGKGTRRGYPEDRDCLRLIPIDIRDAKPVLWPTGVVGKVVLLSATISDVDVADLGLDRRRVCYLECASPIDPDRRRVELVPAAAVSYRNLRPATERICQLIREEILPAHVGERGIIHATYQQARIIRDILGDCGGRLHYHTAEGKQEAYDRFRESPPGTVLVASGMYEGVDLPYDASRFQVLAKVPWLSLGDGAIRHRAEEDPRWYTWNTLRVVIQACGRVCRTPEDHGITYILDSSFRRLYNDASGYGLVPTWFSGAVEVGDGS